MFQPTIVVYTTHLNYAELATILVCALFAALAYAWTK